MNTQHLPLRLFLLLLALNLWATPGSTQLLSENFDDLIPGTGPQIPEGWTAENLNNDNAFWDVLPNSYAFPNNARSAPNAIHMSFDIDDPANDWLFTPALSLREGYRYEVQFWYKNIDTGFDTVEKLKVHLSSAANSQAIDTIPLFLNDQITNQEYDLAAFTFTVENPGDYHLGFHCFSDPFQFLLAMDDLVIEEVLINQVAEAGWTQDLRLYPNPASDQLYLEVPETAGECSLSFFNEQGQLVFQQNQSPTRNPIPLDDLPSGIYAYLIRNSIGESASGHFSIIK